MKRIVISFLSLLFLVTACSTEKKPIRLLVVTGGHGYKVEQFNAMFESLAPEMSYQVVSLPEAYDYFRPEARDGYDAIVLYHMWQKINDEQAADFSECIREGKPVVALHHSINAFDDWEEYWNIIGGKYFHDTTTFKGKEYAPGTYIHDLNFRIKVVDPNHPVTKGVSDFDVFDETYYGYYVEDGVTPLLTTDEPSSTPIVGWTKQYGKSKIVVLQSGHDAPTFENPSFRQLLKQSIEYVLD